MGANGAGKSTLVKILTGAMRPDAGRILIRGEARDVRSPAEARRAGLVSGLPGAVADPRSRRGCQSAPDAARRSSRSGTGCASSASPTSTSATPPATFRSPCCACSTSRARWRIEPDVLLLDEMTAALPAEPRRARARRGARARAEAGRSVIFISHRFLEISALCDRATVLRDGETVGVVDIAPGRRGKDRRADARRARSRRRARRCGDGAGAAAGGGRPARGFACATCSVGTKLEDVSFDLHDGEVAGRRRARRPGAGRAVRRALRLDPAVRRHHRGRRPAGALPPSRRRDRRRASPMCPATAPTRC